MQTFLPIPDFRGSVKSLDRQRLNKQRVEVWQILQALTGKNSGWVHHPATKMWRGYEPALALYGLHASLEWQSRGYKDTMALRFLDALDEMDIRYPSDVVMPPWFGNEEFHASHRANLLRKDPEWYGSFGWADDPNLPYVWPVAS